MATLTSTGINCSNGTLDGQYTGTTANNTSFPIGSYVILSTQTNDPGINTNASASIYTAGNPYYSNTAGGSALSGTWRSRGTAQKTYNCAIVVWGYLMQRTA